MLTKAVEIKPQSREFVDIVMVFILDDIKEKILEKHPNTKLFESTFMDFDLDTDLLTTISILINKKISIELKDIHERN